MLAGSVLVGYTHFHEIQSVVLLLAVFIYLLVQVSWDITETLAFSVGQMQISAWLSVISSLLWLIIVFTIPIGLMTLEVVFCTYVGVQILKSLFYFWWEWRNKYFDSKSPCSGYTISSLELLRQSMPIFGTNLLSLPISQLPLMFLATYSGMNQVAYYSIGSKLSQPIQIMFINIFPAVFPLLSVSSINDIKSFKRQISRIFSILAFGGILIATILSLLGHELVLQLFGEKYLSAIVPLSHQLWVAIQSMMFGLVGLIFIAMNKERTMVRLSLVNAILIGSLSFIGSHYGATGLSATLLFSGVLGFILHWYFIKIMLPDIIGWKNEIKIFFSYICLSTLSYAVIEYSFEIRIVSLIIILFVLWIIFKSEINKIMEFALNTINFHHTKVKILEHDKPRNE